MTNVSVGANAQQETVIDQVFREVFASNKDGCRFNLECITSDKRKFNHGLRAVSKPLAVKEAEQRIQELVSKNTYGTIAYRIVGVSDSSQWVLVPPALANTSAQIVPSAKKANSKWNRFLEFFFDLGEEENE